MNKTSSLQSRFTIGTIVLFILFSGITVIILDRTFHRTLISSEENRLKGLLYSFLSTMDVKDDGAVSIEPDALQTFTSNNNDLSIFVYDEHNKKIWSAGDEESRLIQQAPKTGEWIFESFDRDHSTIALLFGLTWETGEKNKEWNYTIQLVDAGKVYRAGMQDFRKILWTWLSAGCFVLLIVQLLLLKWGFRPLRKLADEVEMIEKGKKHKFENEYPNELSQLTLNINSLLRHERSQQIRYRQSLDNLAHALKTPLAALKNISSQKSADTKLLSDLNEQVIRAKDIVDYQLQKAATVGKNPFTGSIKIKDILEKISRSIEKVYSEKNIRISLNVSDEATIQIDEGDFFELVGNIVENAAKYGKSKIKISFDANPHADLIVEDDGPGFKNEKMLSIVQRGVRQDQRTEGSGIGLSVAYEITTALGGNLELARSATLGGALVRIRFS